MAKVAKVKTPPKARAPQPPSKQLSKKRLSKSERAKARVGKREGCVARATLSGVHLAPRKARLVVNLIRGRRVGTALDLLAFSEKKTGPLLRKLLLSAVQNAKERAGVDVDQLFIKRALVDGTGIMKRFMPRAHGRATKIRKRSSSITILLDEI